MDTERKIYINEEHPLNGPGSAKIYLDTNKSRGKNVNTIDGTAIHLSTDKQGDLGVHINTTFSMTSSKKIKLLFLLNFLLSLVCMAICFSLACYYWQEITSLRRQIDVMKDNFLIHNVQDKITNSALVRPPRPHDEREGRAQHVLELENTKKFFVEDLGDDMLLVDARKKNNSAQKRHNPLVTTTQSELLIAQFNGAYREYKMGTQSLIGPWVRDMQVSSKNSERKIELNSDHVVIRESGLYLVYAQVVYLSHSPNSFYIWARPRSESPGAEPRLVSACATGDDSTARSLDRAQLSCSIQNIARLNAGDTVSLTQREPNRTLIMRTGYSYFGFIKLAP